MKKQRIVIAVIDGLGLDYFKYMDYLNKLGYKGFFKTVKALMPTVTNINNVSICCGAWPDEHGISGNSYYDKETESAKYMNSSELITHPTIFQKASLLGLKSVLLTSKRKTVELFNKYTTLAYSGETPPSVLVDRFGSPPDIYSAEINYWLWQVAIDFLKNRKDIDVIYIHTTDYPMHRWRPEEEESIKHLKKLDDLIAEAVSISPDTAFFVTADHGMNDKRVCLDLKKFLENRGIKIRFFLSPERDYYIVHHRNFAGSCWLWLDSEDDMKVIFDTLNSLNGIEEIMTKEEAVNRFRLPEKYIGDLMVLGDRETVFGELNSELEELPKGYRAHGSLFERDVPLIIYNFDGILPESNYFTHNLHLTRFLF